MLCIRVAEPVARDDKRSTEFSTATRSTDECDEISGAGRIQGPRLAPRQQLAPRSRDIPRGLTRAFLGKARAKENRAAVLRRVSHDDAVIVLAFRGCSLALQSRLPPM